MISNTQMRFLAAAYVRGVSVRTGSPASEGTPAQTPPEALTAREIDSLIERGSAAGLKMYYFKDKDVLPRVKAVSGFLRGVQPHSLLDVGSGRGVFLLPFLSEFPDVPVTSLDLLPYRAQFWADLRAGGIDRISAEQGDICSFSAPDGSFDVVTLLEVLEHIPDVEAAVRNAVRLAGRFVVVSVPSRPDNNPEHIHLLTKEKLSALFAAAGCSKLNFSGVNGHLIMIAAKRTET